MSRHWQIAHTLFQRFVAALLSCCLLIGAAHAYFDPPDPPGGNTQPMLVDPITPGLSPLALPPIGIDPPTGTTEIPSPPGGGLPADIPSLAGASQQLSVNSQTAFADSHVNIDLIVAPAVGSDSYAITIGLRDNDAFSSYTVSETASLVSVRYAEDDGTRSELISASQFAGPLDGGLVWARFDNNLLSALTVVARTGTDETVWEWPGGGALQPGLSNASQLQALSNLVDAQLTGPARTQALDAYYATLGGYLASATPKFGDFNHNGVIDAADYVVWRKGGGPTNTPADYHAWRASFGQTAGSAASSNSAMVPEPATPATLLAGLWMLLFLRRAAAS